MEQIPQSNSQEKSHTPELSAHEKLFLDLRNALEGLEADIQNSPNPEASKEYLIAIGSVHQSLIQAIFEVNKLREKDTHQNKAVN